MTTNKHVAVLQDFDGSDGMATKQSLCHCLTIIQSSNDRTLMEYGNSCLTEFSKLCMCTNSVNVY